MSFIYSSFYSRQTSSTVDSHLTYLLGMEDYQRSDGKYQQFPGMQDLLLELSWKACPHEHHSVFHPVFLCSTWADYLEWIEHLVFSSMGLRCKKWRSLASFKVPINSKYLSVPWKYEANPMPTFIFSLNFLLSLFSFFLSSAGYCKPQTVHDYLQSEAHRLILNRKFTSFLFDINEMLKYGTLSTKFDLLWSCSNLFLFKTVIISINKFPCKYHPWWWQYESNQCYILHYLYRVSQWETPSCMHH